MVLVNLARLDVAVEPTVDRLEDNADIGSHLWLLSAGDVRYFWLRAFGCEGFV